MTRSTGTATAAGYDRIRQMIARDDVVTLDCAMGTKLIKVRGGSHGESEHLCGLAVLLEDPEGLPDKVAEPRPSVR